MVKLLTLNIAGLSRLEKRLAVLNLLKDHEIDIACLQEVTFTQCQHLEGAYSFYVNLGPRKRGTAMLVRRGLQVSSLLVEPDGRLISIGVSDVTYIGLYAPSGSSGKKERNELFKTTIPVYFLASKNPTVLMGDFNAVENLTDRRQNLCQPTYILYDQIALREMIRVLELKDAWRVLRPSESGFTRHNSVSSSRIDRIYVTETVRLEIIALSAITFGGHLPLIASITTSAPIITKAPKTYDLWKLKVTKQR